MGVTKLPFLLYLCRMKAEIIKKFLQKFPNTPSLSLARTIYAEYKHIFSDVESVRGAIRYYRGAHGNKKRKYVIGKQFFNQNYMSKYNIPKEIEISYEPYVLPKSCKNILVINDIHIPFHDSVATEIALEWGEKRNIDTILLNGDIVDFYDVSRFIKTPNLVRVKEEIDMLRQFIDGIHKSFPKVNIYYKLGNHEERIENYMKVKAPELYGIEEFELKNLLGLSYVNFIEDKRIIYAGKLAILHGHEFNGIASSVNAARGLYLRAKQSTVIGHLHQVSEHTEPNLDGEIVTTWSIGCLCQLHPEYARINKWSHGFLNVKIDDNGDFKVFNARIYNGKIL